MFRNHLKVAIRNLRKNKLFSIVNISGLAIGIACSLLLFLFVRDELSFDRSHKHANDIYRAYVEININGKESINGKTAAPLGQAMIKNFPEVISFARVGYFGAHNLRVGEKIFRESNMYGVDSTYFSLFDFSFIAGDRRTALLQPNSMVVTKTMAEKYFGSDPDSYRDALGKSMIVDDNGSYMITGVVEDFSSYSFFNADFLVSMSTYPQATSDNWLSMGYYTYLLLQKGTDVRQLEAKMKNIVLNYVGPQVGKMLGVPIQQFMDKGNTYAFHLQPFTSMHLYSARKYGIDGNTEYGNVKTGDIIYVYIFLAVAVFILLVAVINFMNLSTARSEKRGKEAGVRKTLGSGRSKLINQFLTESTLTVAIAVVIALLLIELVLPLFNEIAGRELSTNYASNIYTLPALITFTLVVGAVAGSYPAFFLSSYQAVDILKTGVRKRKATLRSFLVVTQFSISIALIIAMIVVRSQLSYLQEKNLGFKKEQLLVIFNGAQLENNIKPFKEELLKNPKVVNATNHSLMFAAGIPGNGYLFNRTTGADPMAFQFLNVDCEFAETYGASMVKGRFFSKDFIADSNAVVINEAAMKECGSSNPLGQTLSAINVSGVSKQYTIIGVVKDFNFESLRTQIRPLVFHLGPVQQPASIITLRIRPEDIKTTINFIETTWQRFSKDEKCRYNFLDESLANLYNNEKRTSTIATLFSVLAIFIACLGLFGLAAFVTEQRTKEIGIRKVAGASVTEIIITISKPFLVWVLMANLIAWPAAYIIMNRWLQNFAYRTQIHFWILVVAGIAALIISLLTVGLQAFAAARSNPIKSLRTE
ncbi:MAG TPA: ABC transporter permease [Flavisolibacter sp.]|nr:ABC transporter permease [Flavisolibacter sp.]